MLGPYWRRVRLSLGLLGFAAALTLGGGKGRADYQIAVSSYDFTNSGFDATQQALAKDLFQSAINTWLGTIGSPSGKNVKLTIDKIDFTLRAKDTDDGEKGLSGNGDTEGASADANGLPSKVKEIDIATDKDMFYSKKIDGIKKDQRDAYSTMLHELGHAVGFNYLASGGSDGYQKWDDQIDAKNKTFKLAPAFGGGTVTLARGDPNGLSHVDGTKYPNDLMKDTGALGVRDSISPMDVQMLQTAFGYTASPEPSSMILLSAGTMTLLGYGWRRRKQIA